MLAKNLLRKAFDFEALMVSMGTSKECCLVAVLFWKKTAAETNSF